MQGGAFISLPRLFGRLEVAVHCKFCVGPVTFTERNQLPHWEMIADGRMADGRRRIARSASIEATGTIPRPGPAPERLGASSMRFSALAARGVAGRRNSRPRLSYSGLQEDEEATVGRAAE
jgi:hypothetical protein